MSNPITAFKDVRDIYNELDLDDEQKHLAKIGLISAGATYALAAVGLVYITVKSTKLLMKFI